MKTISTTPEPFESTYALIVRSEEKQRNRLETLVYVVLIVAVTSSVSQFGRQAMTLPAPIVRHSAPMAATVQHRA
jgi:hypothetical protein